MTLVTETRPLRSASITIRRIRATDLKDVITDLTDAFLDTVNNGSALGFLAPITRDMARDHFIALLPEIEAGSRILLVACDANGRVVGSGQLALSQRQNSPHRAELQKLFVSRAVRGQGIGHSLMLGLHHVARVHGRSLISLNTRKGDGAEGFYESLGYRVAGGVPGWTIGRSGEKYDDVIMYLEL